MPACLQLPCIKHRAKPPAARREFPWAREAHGRRALWTVPFPNCCQEPVQWGLQLLPPSKIEAHRPTFPTSVLVGVKGNPVWIWVSLIATDLNLLFTRCWPFGPPSCALSDYHFLFVSSWNCCYWFVVDFVCVRVWIVILGFSTLQILSCGLLLHL